MNSVFYNQNCDCMLKTHIPPVGV
uniref:Uncharacterized protein n=1 Tax=Arundo donax TaxID=35708 RepID=A0A0A9FGC6_ARUDO